MFQRKKVNSRLKTELKVDLPPSSSEIAKENQIFDTLDDEIKFLEFEEITCPDQSNHTFNSFKHEQNKKTLNVRKRTRKLFDGLGNHSLELFSAGSPWIKFHLHPILQHSIIKKGFSTPTPIQASALSHLVVSIDCSTGSSVLDQKIDIIGTAPTGSGKTLAFGLPILHSILCRAHHNAESKISALILVPTRELGLQVERHFLDMIKYSPFSVRIVTLIGGIAIPKQERLLRKQIDILIATPGRLSKFFNNTRDDFEINLAKSLNEIRFLVLDEVDRMTEEHHFKELKSIFNTITTLHAFPYQTFVFSATLKQDSNEWMKRIPFQTNYDSRIHISHREGNADISSSLPVRDIKEYKIKCTIEERDIFLYYFLLAHPGKVLIFVNSVDSIRHIVPMLQVLNIDNVWGIHSQMPQRQRLKNLDRFKGISDDKSCVLVATDVAGRGLDIPQVSYVLHYHIPRSLDIYIHRTGRTGRAGKKGTSLLLVIPQDQDLFDKWSDKTDRIQYYEYDHHIWRQLNERVILAKTMERLGRKMSKEGRDVSWMKKAELELEVDPSLEKRNLDDKKQFMIFRKEMNILLSQPLIPKGFSSSFLTKPSNAKYPIYKQLIKGK